MLHFFDSARTALAEATTVDEVKDIRDRAEALRQYARQSRQTLGMQNQCAEIRIRAERRAGEMLRDMPRHQQWDGRPTEVSGDVTLSDLGVSRNQSSMWQGTAAIPLPLFESYIEETKADGGELTTVGLLGKERARVAAERIADIVLVYREEPYDPTEDRAALADMAEALPEHFKDAGEPERVRVTHALYNALHALAAMPPVADVLAMIPDYQRYRFGELAAACSWLEGFRDGWNRRSA